MNTNPDICASRHGGNQQSQAANTRTNKQRDAEEILGLMEFGKSEDYTCREASEILKMPYTTASARFSDLKRDGLIEPTVRRKTRSGCTAMAWRKVER